MEILQRRLTPDELAEVCAWHYEGPYAIYDIPADADFGDPGFAEGYYPILEGDKVIGICALGAEARVPGQDREADTVDLGFAFDPHLLSAGYGTQAINLAVDELWIWGGARWVRTSVLSWNDRAMKLCLRAGFSPVREFTTPDGLLFTELVRQL